ncbi:hypothetical protein J7J90_03140 [Candidatus Micrarchaeota archaeon]|nr:hypothetical protein [Candidatus Micrarchaeota archaeon]
MGCDKFFYYLNILIFIGLIITIIMFISSGKLVEPVILFIVSIVVMPPDNTYDAEIKECKIVLRKWFLLSDKFSINSATLKLFYKNPKFPYLFRGIITIHNHPDEYIIATNRLCWGWCVNSFLKKYVENDGKVEVYLENEMVKFDKRELILGEPEILKKMFKQTSHKKPKK